MGCANSKIENEETVLRCKERKQLMKEAVTARNAFAAAHSAYTMSLKNTGAALSDYAHGEISSSSAAAAAASTLPSAAVSHPHYDTTLPPPPPPLPNFPLQRAASMPEIKSVHKATSNLSETVIEEGEEGEIEDETENGLRHRSTRSSGGGIGGGVFATTLPPRNATTSDWTPPPPPQEDSKGVLDLDYIFLPMENMAGPSLAEVDHEGSIERNMRERSRRADRVDGNSGGARRSMRAEGTEKLAERPPQPPPPTRAPKKVKQAAPGEGKRGGKGAASINMLQIFNDLDDCFLKASESANDVSKMLEANRLHYHSNFADNRGHIDHSARVLRVITWNKSFRGLPNTDDGLDDFDSEENETHATVLDKMLAWEKKLYDEVKTGEQMKIEYQRKVASLNKLKKHGARIESIEKAKATVSHLHTRYIVDMQSMDSTVSEINRLRDEQLYPKLVALVDGMAEMWEHMKVQHENQKKISTALKSLDISQSAKETTEHHHERTVQLLVIVQEWHSQLHKLMTHQKTYIKALNNWLRLNLIPVDTNLKEKVSSPGRTQSPPIQALLCLWHDQLEKLPDELAITGITSFGAVMNTIVQIQVDEMKLRDKCEQTQKELNRKTRQFDDWYKKYMQKRTPPDEVDPDRSEDKDLVAERKLAVDTVKQKLEDEEEEYQRQRVHVREKSLTALRTQLPELFRVLSEFSSSCFKMYTQLRSITRPKKPNQSSQ
ncbi:protein ROLLING AND ERECT LEAF 2-like isoform X3 [Rhododendron vialii]|uniref:protein ROLLING AND ERECT LEAF 2-like isoform X3 n=1 Tax=Rhododendron vialii TaxID=182163 RepID=UPI00265FF646|nr:protein ROLLING AND ERECT LEAF 2-like isoform X3 [Rhododendron vialii]